jgi:hypothetical protein
MAEPAFFPLVPYARLTAALAARENFISVAVIPGEHVNAAINSRLRYAFQTPCLTQTMRSIRANMLSRGEVDGRHGQVEELHDLGHGSWWTSPDSRWFTSKFPAAEPHVAPTLRKNQASRAN